MQSTRRLPLAMARPGIDTCKGASKNSGNSVNAVTCMLNLPRCCRSGGIEPVDIHHDGPAFEIDFPYPRIHERHIDVSTGRANHQHVTGAKVLHDAHDADLLALIIDGYESRELPVIVGVVFFDGLKRIDVDPQVCVGPSICGVAIFNLFDTQIVDGASSLLYRDDVHV